VFKRVDTLYQPGRRSTHWIKAKHLHHDELVVGGLVTGSGRRRPLTGLVVGWPRDDVQLDYAGVVEVGFRPGERAVIVSTLDRCRSEVCSFAQPPMLSRVEWVEPALVIEVRSLRPRPVRGCRCSAGWSESLRSSRSEGGPVEDDEALFRGPSAPQAPSIGAPGYGLSLGVVVGLTTA